MLTSCCIVAELRNQLTFSHTTFRVLQLDSVCSMRETFSSYLTQTENNQKFSLTFTHVPTFFPRILFADSEVIFPLYSSVFQKNTPNKSAFCGGMHSKKVLLKFQSLISGLLLFWGESGTWGNYVSDSISPPVKWR